MNQYVYAENMNNQPLYRYFVMELVLTSDAYLDSDEGDELATNWKKWLDAEMNTGSCQTTRDTFHGFIHAPDFHQFVVSGNLLSEMRQGVMIAIIVALCVLILATGNIIVGLL